MVDLESRAAEAEGSTFMIITSCPPAGRTLPPRA
jgi:hypothetical protein